MEVNARLPAAPTRARPVDPDAVLVAAAREDPRAFLALYDRYFDRVLAYCRLRLRDQLTCEDVTSTVFTTALAKLGRFRGEGDFSAWLFQIARNAVRDAHRRRVHELLPDRAAGSEPDVEERFLARERAAQLHALIGLLDADQQHLLALRYGAGMAFDEIGAVVGAAPGTVRVRLHRILEDLRRRYPDGDR